MTITLYAYIYWCVSLLLSDANCDIWYHYFYRSKFIRGLAPPLTPPPPLVSATDINPSENSPHRVKCHKIMINELYTGYRVMLGDDYFSDAKTVFHCSRFARVGSKMVTISARNTMRKFANFVRLYLPHITTFFNQILEFYYF